MTFKSIISTRSTIKNQDYCNLWKDLGIRIEGARGEVRNTVMESIKLLKSIKEVMEGITSNGNYIKASTLMNKKKTVRFNEGNNKVMEIERVGKCIKIEEEPHYLVRKAEKIQKYKILIREMINEIRNSSIRRKALARLRECEKANLMSSYGELYKELDK